MSIHGCREQRIINRSWATLEDNVRQVYDKASEISANCEIKAVLWIAAKIICSTIFQILYEQFSAVLNFAFNPVLMIVLLGWLGMPLLCKASIPLWAFDIGGWAGKGARCRRLGAVSIPSGSLAPNCCQKSNSCPPCSAFTIIRGKASAPKNDTHTTHKISVWQSIQK